MGLTRQPASQMETEKQTFYYYFSVEESHKIHKGLAIRNKQNTYTHKYTLSSVA